MTLEERMKIKEGLEKNLSYSQLAVFVGRNKSTVLRESKRLGSPKQYDPVEAQKNFEEGQVEKYSKITALRATRYKKADVVESATKHSESRP